VPLDVLALLFVPSGRDLLSLVRHRMSSFEMVAADCGSPH
jgi:hypothetical protein